MAIAFVTIGARASGTTSIAVPTPASRVDGNCLICARSIWLGTATATDRSGWTPAGDRTGGTGTAADSHTTRVRADFRQIVGNEPATISFAQGNSPSAIAVMAQYSKASNKSWEMAFVTADDAAHAANRSVTTGTLSLAPGDMVVAVVATDTDAALTITSPTFTASGITFGTVTRRTTAVAGSTTGVDGNVEIFDALVSTGTATVATTFAFTTATSQCGPVSIVRLREVNPPAASFPGLIDGVEPETHSRMNVIQNGAGGPLYRVNESYLRDPQGTVSNQPQMFKSTDEGKTWVEMNAAGRPGSALGNIVDLESFSMAPDHDGHSIVMINQGSTRVSFMRFRMASHGSPDTWESNAREDSAIPGTVSPAPQYVSITSPAGQAYDWLFYQAAGGFYRSRTNSTTFGTITAIDGAVALYPAAVLDANDTSVIVYKKAGTPNQLHFKNLTGPGTLDGTSTRLDTSGISAHADHVVPFCAPVAYEGGVGADTVVSVLFTDTSQRPTIVDIVNGTPQTPQLIHTTAVAADEGTTTSLQPIMALAVDGDTLHAVWVETTTWDILHSERTYGGSWSSPDQLLIIGGTDEVAYVTAAIVEHSGTKYLGYTYDLGPHDDNDSNTYYNRLALAAPSTDLVVQNATHAQTSANVALTQDHNLTVAAATHAQTAQNVALVVDLVVQSATHAQTSENVALVQSTNLVVADATHAQTAENVTLTQVHELAVNAATHAQTAESPTLTQVHNLTVDAAVHAQTAENVAVQVVLGVHDATHAHTADNVTLTQQHTLVVQDATHAQTAQTVALVVDLAVQAATHAQTSANVALVQQHNLAVDPAVHGQTAENVGLSSAGDIAPSPAVHAHTAENVTLTQVHTLVVQDAVHGVSSTTVGLVVDLAVQSASHAHTAASVTLIQQHTLAVQAATHAQTAETLALVVDLAVHAATHGLTSTTVALTQLHLLLVEDALHGQTAGELDLAQTHLLDVEDAFHGHTAETVVLFFVAEGDGGWVPKPRHTRLNESGASRLNGSGRGTLDETPRAHLDGATA